MRRLALCALVTTLLGGSTSEVAPRAPLPEREVAVSFPHAWLSSPINLWDVGVPGTAKHDVVGAIGDREVHMRELDEQSLGAFGRIAERIFAARDRGLVWLAERRALERLARDRGVELSTLLHREYDALPTIDARNEAALQPYVSLIPEERERHARAAVRYRTYAIARSVLVHKGLATMDADRLQANIFDPSYRDDSTPLARLDGTITRGEIIALAGSAERVARAEYFRILELQWDKLVTATLRASTTIDPVTVTDAEIDAVIEEQPQYATDRGRAAALAKRRKEDAAEKALDATLRAEANVALFARLPANTPVSNVGAVAPFTLGPADAAHTVTVFTAFGCARCATATERAQSIAKQYPSLRVQLVEYAPEQAAAIRGAMAVRCSGARAWAMMHELARDPGGSDLASLSARAEHAGVDVAEFRACMESDRFVPELVENTRVATRVCPEPPERAVPFFYLDGVLLPSAERAAEQDAELRKL